MEKLPNETLCNIFDLLPIAQKQECLFVCKRWTHVIRSQSLFRSLYICFTYDQFKRFIRLIERHPELVHQVQEVTFSYIYSPVYNPVALLRLFPNIKVVKTTTNRLTLDRIEDYVREENHKLEYLEGINTVEMVVWALQSPSRLVSLSVVLNPIDDMLVNNFIPLLKNATLLKHLDLGYSKLKVEQFDAIHDNVLSLESLILRYCELFSFSDTEMTPPNPAKNMKKLNLHEVYFINKSPVEWYRYIGRKYPNLEQFDQSLYRSMYPTSEFISKYIQYYPLIIQQRLSSVSLICGSDVDGFKSVLNLLDICNIETVKLSHVCFDHLILLSQSEQKENIKRLEINTPITTLIFGTWMKNMISLKSLVLDFNESNRKYFDLENCLKYCPDTMESISLTAAEVNLEATGAIFPAIKELYLKYKQSYFLNFERFITTALPNLHVLKLELKNAFEKNHDILTMSLPNNHFTFIDLRFTYKPSDPFIRLETSGKTMFFIEGIVYTDYSLLGTELLYTSENKMSKRVIHLTCASVKKMHVNDRPLLL